ncbi:MAG: hypothetical protein V1739_07215 [Candidatus Omnitrophota bacterium]
MNRFSTIIKIIIFLFLVGGSAYAINRLDFFKKQTSALKVQTTELIKATEYLEQSLDEEKKENAARGAKVNILLKELAGLQDTKRIKEEFAESQEKLRLLNNDHSVAKQENLKLNQINLSLNHRLTKLTNEFTKTLEDVSRLQAQVNESKDDKFVRKFVLQLEKTEAVLQKREEELEVLKGKNKTLSLENAGFNKEKKMLEQNVMRLEKENSKMETLVNKIRDDFNEQQRMQAKLKEEDSNLTAKLRENEIERNKLDQQIGTLSTQKETFAGKLELQNKKIAELENELLDIDKKARQIRKIEQARDDLALELKLAQEKVKDQEQIIARLEAAQKGISVNEIPLAKSAVTTEIEGDLSKAYALYDTAKAQVVKFSEMLMSKEVEIETSKKRIAELEEGLKMLRLQPEASGDKKYAMLYDRIKMLNDSLLAKDELLQEKEAEVSALKQAKDTVEQRLEYQEKEYKNANMLYSNLKGQLLQSTELLARRESEVIEKNKEVLNLKSELILVQAEYKIKEQELKDLRMQQNKTLEDLSRITNLNISLQQNPGDSFSQDERQNADKLKKELEVLLGK